MEAGPLLYIKGGVESVEGSYTYLPDIVEVDSPRHFRMAPISPARVSVKDTLVDFDSPCTCPYGTHTTHFSILSPHALSRKTSVDTAKPRRHSFRSSSGT